MSFCITTAYLHILLCFTCPSIPNLEDKQGLRQGPVIGLKARSLLPYCHFELEDSDYIRSARRNPELRGPRGAPAGTTLDPNTRVIEFKNIGVNVKNVRKFHIVNPTSQEYTFNWVNEDEVNPKKTPEFTCLTPEGSIRSGKKAEVRILYMYILVMEELLWLNTKFISIRKSREIYRHN